eukprot:COSAG02_NODE_1066_length_14828_cov_8.021794_11_plen_93_part_00
MRRCKAGLWGGSRRARPCGGGGDDGLLGSAFRGSVDSALFGRGRKGGGGAECVGFSRGREGGWGEARGGSSLCETDGSWGWQLGMAIGGKEL